MAATPNSGDGQGGRDDLAQVKRKLAWRMGIAGLMIVGLLGGLMLFDRLTASRNESEPSAPQYTEPVPVPRKSVTQPLSSTEPGMAELRQDKKDAEPEATATPAEKPAPSLAIPAAPEVAAQPSSPRPEKPAVRPAVANSTPARRGESKADTAAPAEPRSPTPVSVAAPTQATAPASPRQPPVLPRLLSGYTLQAGVFADPQRAEDLHARLVQEGIPATLETRVLVGPFRSREEARAARAKMLTMGVDAVQLPRVGKK